MKKQKQKRSRVGTTYKKALFDKKKGFSFKTKEETWNYLGMLESKTFLR